MPNINDLKAEDYEIVEQPSAGARQPGQKTPKTMNISDIDPSEIEEVAEAPSPVTSAIRSFARGASFGFSDELGGLLEAAGSKIGVRGLGKGFDDIRLETEAEDQETFGQIYDKTVAERRAAAQLDEKLNPVTSTVAGLAGSLAAPVPGATLAKGASLGAKALKGAGVGAAIGGLEAAGRTEEKVLSEQGLKDIAEGLAIGAFAGGALPVAGAAYEKAKNKISKTFSGALDNFIPTSSELKVQATKASPGKVRDIQFDRPDSVERMADFIDANKIQSGMTSSTEQFRRVKKATNDIGKELGKVYREQGKAISKDELVQDLGDIALMTKSTEVFDETASKKLAEIASNIQTKFPDGDVSFENLVDLRKMIDKKTKFTSDSAAQESNKAIRRVFREIEDKLLGDALPKADSLRKQYQAGKELEYLLEGAASRETSRQLIGLKDLAAGQAGGVVDIATGVPFFSVAVPVMNKIANKYGEQIGAKVIDAMNSSNGIKITKSMLKKPTKTNLAAVKKLAKQHNIPVKALIQAINNAEEE